ncbi:MAG: nucleotidyltransferase family protein [Desulfitobacterium sp.]
MLAQCYTVDEIKAIVSDVAERYGVERVVLFGSYARGEANPSSDIDLRIDKGKIRGLFELSGFKLDLEERLDISVDVMETEGLSERFLKRIGEEEILLYEQ